jgi:hypothetical protein
VPFLIPFSVETGRFSDRRRIAVVSFGRVSGFMFGHGGSISARKILMKSYAHVNKLRGFSANSVV